MSKDEPHRQGRGRRRRRSRRRNRRPAFGLWLLLGLFVLLQIGLSLGDEVFLLDAANHFRPWVTALTALPVVALGLRKRRGWPVAATALLIAAMTTIWPWAALGSRGTPMAARLAVVSFNILGNNPHTGSLTRWLAVVGPDVIAIQEASGLWRAWIERSPLADRQRLALAVDEGRGVELLASRPMMQARVLTAPQRRPLAVAVIDFEGPVCVVSMHPDTARTAATWRARNEDLSLAAYWIRSVCPANAEKIVMGDWNTPPWSARFARFLRANDLRWANASAFPAVTRALGPPFGWLGSPIDHIAVTPGLTAVRCRRGPPLGSDHRPIACEIARTRGS